MPDVKDNLTKSTLLISSFTVFFLLAFAAYKEDFGADWYRFQSDYKHQLLERAASERERQAAERFDVGQKQLYLPDLNRIDRCVTCHVAIDNPSMADAAQPLTAHPGQIMLDHPKEQFGCTICHSGQGRATLAADAHGHVDHWPQPMLADDRLDESCPKCHTERFLPGVDRYNAAMELVYEHGCFTCHKLRSRGGDIGPDITNAGEVHDAEWHFKHFKDPKSVVETSEMPNENLSDEEARLLTFLMMSYVGEAIPTALLSNPKQPGGQMELPEPLDPLALEGYVGSEFCVSCHGAMHPETVKVWRDSPMTSTYERIRNEPIKDNCLPCHTTGLNTATGHYSEEGVGCEACHGPGREAVRHVLAGKVLEHKQMIRIDQDSAAACERCHNPHVATETHAEFYRKLPPRSAQPNAPEKASSRSEPEPERGQILAPSSGAPVTAQPDPGPAIDAIEETSEAPVSGMMQPRVLRYATDQREPAISRFEILSATSTVRPPEKIEGGCVSSECHPTTVFGKFVHGPTAQQDCDQCHRLTDEPRHKFELTREEPYLCYDCHDPPPKHEFVHGPVALGVCRVCHNPHSGPYEYMLPATGNALCFTCHMDMDELVETVTVKHQVIAEEGCQACHDPHAGDFDPQLKKDMGELCMECHEPIREIVEEAVVRHGAITEDKKCANCHSPHGGDLPVMLVDKEVNLCLDCHDEPMETDHGPIINMKAWIEKNPERHGPVREGNCTLCHQPHGSKHFRILSHEFPRKFYSPFSVEVYELCFQCHEETLVLDELTATLTDFRNGNKNLHYVHVNQKRGRTCRACHEVHAGTKPKRIKDFVPYGTWEYPINFELAADGGKCAPGCHLPRAYNREHAVEQQ